MDALATAIENALTRPDPRPTGPRGLDRRRLGALPVAAQAVATVAPSPGMVSATALATSLGAAAVPVFGLATLMMVLVGLVIAQFARRMTAAGALYTYAAKGLGPAGGFLTGCLLLLAYGAMVVMCLLGAGRQSALFLASAGVPWDAGRAAPLIAALLGVAMTAFVIRGIRISASLTLLLEACSVVTVLAVLILSALHGSVGVPSGSYVTDSYASGTAAAALIVSVTALVGFESGCGLGVEARRPFAVVPRVLIWTPAGCGLLFVLAGTLHLAGPGGNDGEAVPFLPVLLHLGLASSLFACAMAFGNAVIRVLFTMGREGMVPRMLSRTHPRHRTPHAAAYAMTPFAIILPAVLWATGLPPGPLPGALSAFAVLSFLAAYLLVCIAAPLFLHRIGEFVPATTALAVLGACACATALAGAGVIMVGEGRAPLLVLFGLALCGGMAWFLRVRDRAPHRAAAIGYFDPAAPEDMLPGAAPK